MNRKSRAREELASHTGVAAERKSGIITITVTDRGPQRPAAMAQAYPTELDHLLAQVSTSFACHERIFLEEGRSREVKHDRYATAERRSRGLQLGDYRSVQVFASARPLSSIKIHFQPRRIFQRLLHQAAQTAAAEGDQN